MAEKAPATLLSRIEMLSRVRITYPAVLARIHAGTFPRPRKVGRRSFWVASEIEAWINALPPATYKFEQIERARKAK
jgi:predicted DNA-binding transcriptional regulator AlpA